MNTDLITERTTEMSPRFQARLAGAIAWITTTSAFAIFVRAKLVVSVDAAATAHNILTHELLYRLGFLGDVLALLYILYTLLLYSLFRPVSRSLSLPAAVFSLVGCAVQAVLLLFLLAPLHVLKDAHPFSAFTAEQSQDLALTFLKLHAQGYTVSMLLFGSYNILIGYLIVRSSFLPRILGVLLTISGVCYQIDNFAAFLSPSFQARLEPYILVPGAAELLLALWLVVVGVNVERWKEQANRAGASQC